MLFPELLMAHTGDRILEDAKTLIEGEARALSVAAAAIDSKFNEVIRLILDLEGKLVLTGVGKSGLVASKIASTFSSTGTPAYFLHPTEALHGDLGSLGPKDLLFTVGKSGESREILELLEASKRLGIRSIALTNRAGSSVSIRADVSLVYPLEHEACPYDLAPTTSSLIALAIGDALALTVMKLKDFRPKDFAKYHPGGKLGQRLYTRVREIMIPIDRCPPLRPKSARFEDVVTALGSLGLVVFSETGTRLDGILTDGDVRRLLEKHRGRIFDIGVSEMMNPNPLSIEADRLAVEALEFMEKRDRPLNVMPVVHGPARELVGVIRLHELLRVF